MTREQLFVRKIAYLSAMAVLFVALYALGRPAARGPGGGVAGATPGGKLAQLRAEYRLGQAQFGEIDAAGETIKLASLGLQGFATMALWQQAHEYKTTENWLAYEQALNQLSKLMPNYVNVWKFQAWNLAFNIPVEFDDHRHRYQWVKKGIAFLHEGLKYNADDPRLLWELGWFVCQKISRSDEQREFRRMYRAEFGQDSWLVGKSYFLQAQAVIDREGVPFSGLNPVVFHNQPALTQSYYAQAVELDGLGDDYRTLGTGARRDERLAGLLAGWKQNWQQARDDWRTFSQRPFPVGQSIVVRFDDWDEVQKSFEQTAGPLFALDAKYADSLLADTELEETAAQAYRKPAEQRTDLERRQIALALFELERVSKFLGHLPPEKQAEARRLAEDGTYHFGRRSVLTQMYHTTNFPYWRLRADIEVRPAALRTWQLLDEARQAHAQARLQPARALFEAAFREWQTILAEHPVLADDSGTGVQLGEAILEYRRLLVEELDQKFPESFPLSPIIESMWAGRPEYDLFHPEEAAKVPPPEPESK